MPILVECTHCGEVGEVSRSAGGCEVKCDKCGRAFMVRPGAGHLTVEWGIGKTGTRVLIVPGRICKIGRAPDNELILSGERVSRHHAELHWTEDGWYLRDLGSGNGTVLDGQPISSASVDSGSRFTIGDYVVRVTLATARPSADEAALSDLASHESSLSGYRADALTHPAHAGKRAGVDPSAETLLNDNAGPKPPQSKKSTPNTKEAGTPRSTPPPSTATGGAPTAKTTRMPGWALLLILACVMLGVVVVAWLIW